MKALPSVLGGPKGIKERIALKKQHGSNSSNSSPKNTFLRNRANSLKWAKCTGGGVFEIGLGQGDLRRC